MPDVQNIPDRGLEVEPKDDKVADESTIKIALADDHTIFRDGLRRLLSLEPDFQVVAEAKDGSEVMDLLAQHEPDIQGRIFRILRSSVSQWKVKLWASTAGTVIVLFMELVSTPPQPTEGSQPFLTGEHRLHLLPKFHHPS
jgi:hypothetical protein